MKTLSPLDYQWQQTPLPQASLVHTDSRIIIMNSISDDVVEVAVLAPYVIGPKVYYWRSLNAIGKTYAPNGFQLVTLWWAWHRRFE